METENLIKQAEEVEARGFDFPCFCETENVTKQAEEVEALSSIYGDDWSIESATTRSYSIRILDNKNEVRLYVIMPPDYPTSPPTYELSAPWMERKAKTQLHRTLDEVYLNHIGQEVIFQWVEKIREVLQAIKPAEKKIKAKPCAVKSLDMTLLDINCPAITHGEVIVDRKSAFQGHAAEVHCMEEVHAVLKKLKLNRKILNAKHNMYAYRIERKTAKGATILDTATMTERRTREAGCCICCRSWTKRIPWLS